MRKVLAIISFLLLVTQAKATHIVGGDFYYQLLSNGQYRITMKLYIDCYNGNPQAIESDEFAIFGIFDSDNQLLFTREIQRTGPIHLLGKVYKCIVNPTDVCVDQYNYTFDIDLPQIDGGYTIAFQRCCRNNTIKNLVDAAGTGATYWVHIPDKKIVSEDNSPIFKKFPPIYVCTGFPLVFDHSATDADGDSLVYELYQPYTGADKDAPRPNPPANPPFKNVTWGSGYSTNNPMYGNPILKIDEETGELTVTPNITGQFVIGVKVKEYRNGVLIGETLRDYQFNVVDCQAIAVANFKAITACSDTVKFQDKSLGTTSLTWDFGDPASGVDNSSNLKNPTHIYKLNGDYTVKLKAWNPACEDEISIKVKVRTKKGFNLGADKVFCATAKQVISVPFTDYQSILWSTGSKASFISVAVPPAGKYWVTAQYENCPPFSDTVNLGYNPVSFKPIADSLFCDSVKTSLSVKNRSAAAKIIWSVGDTSATVNIKKEGKYWVRVYNKNCALTDTINLVKARIQSNLGPDRFYCNNFTATLDAGSLQSGVNYLWQDGSMGQTFTTTSPGKYWVTTTLKHCTASDTLTIANSKVLLNIGPDKHFCDSIKIVLDAGPPNGNAPTTYLWNNGATTQTITVVTPGIHTVTKRDSFGCSNSDSIFLTVSPSPIIDLGKDTIEICMRDPKRLTPGPGFTIYRWSTGSGDSAITTEIPGKYFVTVVDEAGCTGSDTIIVLTNPNLIPNIIYIPNAFTPNGDGLNDVFPFETPVLQNDYNLKIFNRWGEKVYDSNTNRAPWNGETRQDDSQLDAYMWIVSYKGCDGVRHTDKGTVTIIR